MKTMSEELYTECNERQLRQYLDSSALCQHVTQAQKEAAEVRGSMMWREVNGGTYLIRNNAGGGQHSLGKRSPETQEIYDRFMARKSQAQETLKVRKERLDEARKLNRVYGVGRTPNIVVAILKELERAGVSEQFMTVGTHALYAYEALSGVRVLSGALATQDVDLLFDTRQRVAFMTTMKRLDTSLIGILQRADKSFRVMPDKLQTAVNKDAFEVDLIRRTATDGDPHPLRMSDNEDDFWAAQIASGERLISGRRIEQVVVATNGEMALMRTVHPLDFIAVKRALSESRTREAAKRPRDALQARIVESLWENYMKPAQEEQPRERHPTP
jgi:hypothetical protein